MLFQNLSSGDYALNSLSVKKHVKELNNGITRTANLLMMRNKILLHATIQNHLKEITKTFYDPN